MNIASSNSTNNKTVNIIIINIPAFMFPPWGWVGEDPAPIKGDRPGVHPGQWTWWDSNPRTGELIRPQLGVFGF
jgi:hypothetical protein